MKARSRGFTLLELLVTVLVLGVVMAVAAPAFNQMVARSRINAAANELVAGLQTARMTAVRINGRGEICPSTDGATCSGSDWRRFIVVARKGTNATVERDVELNSGNMVVIASPSVTAGTPNRIWFLADGFARTGTAATPTQAGAIGVCTTRLSGENARDVQINVSRINVFRKARAACGAPANPTND